jgi:hypothetical protein
VIFSVFIAGLLTSPAMAGGGNCQDKLVGNSYNCDFKLSTGESFSYCVEFETGGISSNFDLLIPSATTDYGCACLGKGSYTSPKFDSSSSEFQCTVEDGSQIDGKIASKKLSGQGAGFSGTSLFFTCTESSSPC